MDNVFHCFKIHSRVVDVKKSALYALQLFLAINAGLMRVRLRDTALSFISSRTRCLDIPAALAARRSTRLSSMSTVSSIAGAFTRPRHFLPDFALIRHFQSPPLMPFSGVDW